MLSRNVASLEALFLSPPDTRRVGTTGDASLALSGTGLTPDLEETLLALLREAENKIEIFR